MGRRIDEKRNVQTNNKDDDKKDKNELKIVIKCFISSFISSLILYLFGISTICIGSLDPDQFKKIFPDFKDVDEMNRENVKCPEKSSHRKLKHTHEHVHSATKQGGKNRTPLKGGNQNRAWLNNKMEKLAEYLFCGAVSYDNKYYKTKTSIYGDSVDLDTSQQERTDDATDKKKKSGILNNEFFKWLRFFRWTTSNSITNSFWYGPFKWVTSYFKGLGLLGRTLYQNDIVKNFSTETVNNALQNNSTLMDKAKIVGGIFAGGVLALCLMIGVFCLGTGSMFYTAFKGAIPSENLSKGWGSLGILFNPVIWFGIMSLGFTTTTVYFFLSLVGGLFFRRKALLSLIFNNNLVFFMLFGIMFLSRLAASGASDSVWISAFCIPIIVIMINYKKIYNSLKPKK